MTVGRSVRELFSENPRGLHPPAVPAKVKTRDATFRKMTNQNQTNTNEIATTESKYPTYFYFDEKYQYLTKF